jgi:hypothetical protein
VRPRNTTSTSSPQASRSSEGGPGQLPQTHTWSSCLDHVPRQPRAAALLPIRSWTVGFSAARLPDFLAGGASDLQGLGSGSTESDPMFGSSESEISAACLSGLISLPPARSSDYKYGVTRERRHTVRQSLVQKPRRLRAASSGLSTAQTGHCPLPSTGSLSLQAGPPGEGRSGQTRRSDAGGGTARNMGNLRGKLLLMGKRACQPLRGRERRRRRERLARKREPAARERPLLGGVGPGSVLTGCAMAPGVGRKLEPAAATASLARSGVALLCLSLASVFRLPSVSFPDQDSCYCIS